jgi:hypothetical protein
MRAMRVGALLVAAGCGFTKLPPLADRPDAPVAPPPSPDAIAVTADAFVPPDAPPDASPCQLQQLVAGRTYGVIPLFFDALLIDLAGKTAALPAELPVSKGNAANRCARVTFQTELIGTTQCVYKGGATVDHVGTDPAQIAAGMKYTLQHCKAGVAVSFADCGGLDIGAEVAMTAGEAVAYKSLTLRVDDGDDQLGPTEVTVVLDVCDS